jgi:hypothetical protein
VSSAPNASAEGVDDVHRLIELHGRKANMVKWKELLNGDCPRRDAHSLQESLPQVMGSSDDLLNELTSDSPLRDSERKHLLNGSR